MNLFTAIALFFATACGVFAQESAPSPQVTVGYMNAQACQSIASITVLPKGTCVQYVTAYISDTDANVQAFFTVLSYIDQDGQARVQTQVTPAATSVGIKVAMTQFFGVDNIKINSVQVTALEFAGATATLTSFE